MKWRWGQGLLPTSGTGHVSTWRGEWAVTPRGPWALALVLWSRVHSGATLGQGLPNPAEGCECQAPGGVGQVGGQPGTSSPTPLLPPVPGRPRAKPVPPRQLPRGGAEPLGTGTGTRGPESRGGGGHRPRETGNRRAGRRGQDGLWGASQELRLPALGLALRVASSDSFFSRFLSSSGNFS